MKCQTSILSGVLSLFFATQALADGLREPNEADFNRAYCSQLHGSVEVAYQQRNSKVKVDCLTGLYAIEVDWSNKWAESIGQALNYAVLTRRNAGVILICKNSERTCANHIQRMKVTVRVYRLPIDVWFCSKNTFEISACKFDPKG